MVKRIAKMTALGSYLINELEENEPTFLNQIATDLKGIWTYNSLKRWFYDYKDNFQLLDIKVVETTKGILIEKKQSKERIELELRKISKKLEEIESKIK